jgi:antitoxin component of RelBE/YafQ-DinJ toxin-antitoxin module
MAKTTNGHTIVTISVPRQLKSDFREVCRESEMSMSRSVRLFMRESVNGRISIGGLRVKKVVK